MLSLPDFTEKKILFVFPQKDVENQLKFSNSNLKLYRDGKMEDQISLHLLIGVFVIGDFTMTSYLVRKFREHGISVFLLNKSFKHYAAINAEAEGNTELRHIQYTQSEDRELEFAKILISNKTINQYNLIAKYQKQKPEFDLKEKLTKIENAKDADSLLGLEGSIAKSYFSQAFAQHNWYRRAPTTKEDINNLLLDIGYSMTFNFTDSLLRLFGFDTYRGFYHKLYFQRKSLSCDVMEPIRSMVDKSLLRAYNLGRIDEDDFKFRNGSFEFKNWEVRKKYTGIFASPLMKQKDEIYKYILSWYRFYHDSEKYPAPRFHLRH